MGSVWLVTTNHTGRTQAVARTFTMRFRLGEFDRPEAVPYRDERVYGRASLDTDESRALALQVGS